MPSYAEMFGNPMDDMSPTDALKLRMELANKPVAPEQAATNRRSNLYEALSMTPGPGNAIAAKDAYTGAGDAYKAFQGGDYKQSALAAALAGLSGFGAVTGLPVGKMASRVAREAPNTAFAFPAWHGSPHDFDEFKMDKIGTGEGAQSYGHGLYFAENPAVAKAYHEGLSPFAIEGKPIADRTLNGFARAKTEGVLAEMRAELVGKRDTWASRLNHSDPEEVATAQKMVDRSDRELAMIDQVNAANITKSGRLYHTEIDAEPHQLLDWDKPLSEQSENVKAGLKAFYDHSDDEFDRIKGITGGEWMRNYSGGIPRAEALDTSADISAALREAGIPGIKYLDQGSREAGGTSNYVIFDDKLVKIKSKE